LAKLFVIDLKMPNQNTIITTKDGSHTLFSKEFGEHYHSTFGAIQESAHIFIDGALESFQVKESPIGILEIGFGTGLNALLTLLWANKNRHPVSYHGLEAYPISFEVAGSLNYHKELQIDQELFLKLHPFSEETSEASEFFTIRHDMQTLEMAAFPIDHYDIIYFDAFSPEVQPELWTSEIFQKLFRSLKKNGVLTTYSCKGDVKRAMKTAGFEIEKLPGPPGKREFLRGIKYR
jgi:tRNA U34 5-methylaminomethyl-2-thiouridine-forming methyltransferase MnmC